MAMRFQTLRAGYDQRPVLFDATGEIRQGECLGVFGHNGAGKTTLLRVLGGTLRASGGRQWVDTGDGMPERPVVRLVPQEEMVFEHLTTRENLRIGLWNDRVRWRTAASHVDAVCDFLPALRGLLDRRAGALSGGERRQVALARALLAEPDVLLVDEPCLGLSPVAIDLVVGKLRELSAAGGTVVIVEQNLPAALRLIHRYYLMRQGRIVDVAPVDRADPDQLSHLEELI